MTTRPQGASLTAFELLLDIDRRCRLLIADQPLQDTRLQQWSGIGFRVARQWFVAPMVEVAEVLREPRSSRVPGVQPWVRGMANLRGRLLPVMDLGSFFGLGPGAPGKQRRVLVLDHEDLFAGLLVDEVLGLQHFNLSSLDLSPPQPLLAAAAPFVQGHFPREHNWAIFSPFALAQAPGFLDVAL
ncbi:MULTISPECIES: chemotaxis protein CheW [Pseudomonas]|uniref:Twitching motility protein PilI n=1 Tax=Pseudomonas hunanensis TaxID=1247546 RepID=A0ACC6K2G8_9PSED|nr:MULTISPECIES: chemotaxis protein CheW [Pseudomonas]MBP2260085.1 twitching motility protein PilI [Pseudomonas sp. BP8]MDR6712664.1 twitching motility protein PilI [Pseudomonas hunanensis]HDS1734769.1 chemotaxis protein CheW [Pseudomonas putida]